MVGGGCFGGSVTVGAFSFSGLALTRHFSGSSKAAFSSWASSSDLAVGGDAEGGGGDSEGEGEKREKFC